MQSIKQYLMNLRFSAVWVKMAMLIVVGTYCYSRANKKTHGKQGVVQQVSGTSHSKGFVVKWSDMRITTESSQGICLPSIFEK